jgi:hypothetical protein
VPLEEISARPYRRGDEGALVALFAEVFGRQVSEDQWRWKLKPAPSHIESVFVGARGDRLVAQYAGIPLRYLVAGRERTGVVSVDTMTAPAFRRRGLLTRLGALAYDEWKRAGVSFVLGLPNDNWGSRTRALGWKPLFGMKRVRLPLRPAALLKRRLGRMAGWFPDGAFDRCLIRARALARAPWVRQVSNAPRGIETLLSDRPVALIRDQAFLGWRYFSSPAARYEAFLAERDQQVLGFGALRLRASGDRVHASIAELAAPLYGHLTRGALLGAMIDHAARLGATVFDALVVPNSPEHKSLSRAGFLFEDPRQAEVELVPLDPELPFETVSDPRSWYLLGGDFDLV